MIVLCAWCKKFIREKEPKEDKSVSHSCCEECKKKVDEQIKKQKKVQQFILKTTYLTL